MSPRVRLALVVLAPLLAGLTACGGGGSDSGTSAVESCGTLPTADPGAKLPDGIPVIDQVLYEPSVQGKTTIVFGLVRGDDFVQLRDDLADRLEAAGWTLDGTDQESVEAEAQFSKAGPLKTGTIKVQPLCKGYLSVRYKVND